MTSHLRAISLWLLLVAVAACDSDSNDDDVRPGTYSATVTGTVNTTLSGTAVATGSGSTGGWGIVLSREACRPSRS